MHTADGTAHRAPAARTTLCGLLVAEPSLVMLMLEVLEARMVCTDVICAQHSTAQQWESHTGLSVSCQLISTTWVPKRWGCSTSAATCMHDV